MAQDLGQDFSATLTAFSGLGATIAAGANDDAAELDLSSSGNAPLALEIEAIVTTGTGTPDGNEQAVLTFRWGASTGNTTDSTNEYHKEVVSVPTASTTFKKTFRVPVLNSFLLLNVENDQVAGPDIAASSTFKYRYIYGNQQ